MTSTSTGPGGLGSSAARENRAQYEPLPVPFEAALVEPCPFALVE
jgi:hypothetical protein